MSRPIPFGNYELLERIAEGGMAEVWRARAKGVAGFEKTVVVKRVLPSLLERPGFAENPFARHTLVGLRDPRLGGTL